jgi:hypothetical protein
LGDRHDSIRARVEEILAAGAERAEITVESRVSIGAVDGALSSDVTTSATLKSAIATGSG